MNLPYLGGGGLVRAICEPEEVGMAWLLQGCALIFDVCASIKNLELYIFCVCVCVVDNCECALRFCLSSVTSLVPNARFNSRSLVFFCIPVVWRDTSAFPTVFWKIGSVKIECISFH